MGVNEPVPPLHNFEPTPVPKEECLKIFKPHVSIDQASSHFSRDISHQITETQQASLARLKDRNNLQQHIERIQHHRINISICPQR